MVCAVWLRGAVVVRLLLICIVISVILFRIISLSTIFISSLGSIKGPYNLNVTVGSYGI